MYWKIRGLRTPIVYCLEFAGETYEEDLFELKADKDGKYNFTTSYSESRWGAELKPKSECAFPNIPCLIDGDVKITQMTAIMSYICRKNKVLMPKTDAEITQMEMMNGVIGDMRTGFTRLCYMPDSDTAMDTYTNTDDGIMGRNLPVWRRKMNKFLKQNAYCAGDSLTYADMNLFELLDAMQEIIPGCFDADENIKAYHKKIGEIPQIKAYRDSDRFQAKPVNNLVAVYK